MKLKSNKTVLYVMLINITAFETAYTAERAPEQLSSRESIAAPSLWRRIGAYLPTSIEAYDEPFPATSNVTSSPTSTSASTMPVINNTLNKALIAAVDARNIDKIRELITQGADVNTREETSRKTLLHLAVEKGNLDVVNTLLEGGADPNMGDPNLERPLHAAAKRKEENAHIAQALVGKGATVDIRDADLETPLHKAVRAGNFYVLNLLTANNADIGAKNKLGQTTIDVAKEAREKLSSVE